MSGGAPLWQYAVVLLAVAASVAGLALHLLPGLNTRARQTLGRMLRHPHMPASARHLAQRLASPTPPCGGCKAYGPSRPAIIALPISPRHWPK